MATWQIFNSFREGQYSGSVAGTPIDFDTDTMKVALINSTLAPSVTTHSTWSNLNSNEVSGTNYTAGGETLTMTVNAAGATVTIDGTDPQWLESGTGFSNARYAVFYKDSGTASTSPLVAYVDFTTNKGNTTGNLSIQIDVNGIIQVT